jgi:hypothetical protein
VKHLCVQTDGANRIRLSGLDLVLLDCLQSLPDILDQRDAPGVRRRLFPDPTTAETEVNSDWQRLMTPELHHLFVAAGETVVRDLATLAPDLEHKNHFQITFATDHLNAWMSALNQARLILAELFTITDADMNRTDFDLDQPKDLAVFRIHILGYLLQLLVEHASG